MTPLSDTGPAIAAIVGLLVYLLLAAGVYVWYALALSKLFPKLGGEGWKGWVPVLNDMEVLVRGGVPGWSIVFAFIPFVNLYYLYLRIVAAHRIGVRFGRGAGTTVFAILLPPLWATLLATAQPLTGAPLEQRVAGYAGQGAGVPPVPPATPTAAAQSVPTSPLAVGLAPAGAPMPPVSPMPPVPPGAPVPPVSPAAPHSATTQAPPAAPVPSAAAPAALAPSVPVPSGSAQPVLVQSVPAQSAPVQSTPARSASAQPADVPSDAAPSANAPATAHPETAQRDAAPSVPGALGAAPLPPDVPPSAVLPDPPALIEPPARSKPSAPVVRPAPTATDVTEPAAAEAPAPLVRPAPDTPMAADPSPSTAAEPVVPVVRPAPPNPAGAATPEGAAPPVPPLPPVPPVPPVPSVPPTPSVSPAPSAPSTPAPPPTPGVPAPGASVAAAPVASVPTGSDADGTAAASPHDEDDEFGETILVDRRPRIRYLLQVEGAPAIPLSSDTVVLGRKPATGEPGTQDVAVPDTTRTLSKVHARVQRGEGGWTITDLESTNGVVVVADDGTETLLDRGASAPATGRFILGKVAMSIVEEGPST